MFKKTLFFLFICVLFMGCNSVPKQTVPVPVEKPAPKPEPKPEIITRVIEPVLEFADEVEGKAERRLSVRVIESYVHGAPKKIEVTGPKIDVEWIKSFALGEWEDTSSFTIRKSNAEDALQVVNSFLTKKLLTSASITKYSNSIDELRVSITGTALGVKKFANILAGSVPAVIQAKPAVIERAASLLQEDKIKGFVQKAGDPTLYVVGSQSAINALNKLAADNK